MAVRSVIHAPEPWGPDMGPQSGALVGAPKVEYQYIGRTLAKQGRFCKALVKAASFVKPPFFDVTFWCEDDIFF